MKKWLAISLLFSALSSCVKMPDSEVIKTIDNLVIPADFNWKTVKELTISVGVTSDGSPAGSIYIIKIFNSPLLTNGALIATGAAKPGSPYVVKISVATPTSTLYIQEIKPNGLVSVVPLNVTSANLSLTMLKTPGIDAAIDNQAAFKSANATFTSPVIAIPANYDVTVNNNNTLQLVGFNTGESSAYGNTYKSYIIPAGFTRTANIDFGNWLSHSILYVQGTLNIARAVALNKCSIVVLNGGKVTVDGVSNGGGNTATIPIIEVKSGGTFTSTSDINISNGVTIVNKGTYTAEGNRVDLDVNSSSKFYNEGTLNVSSTRALFSVTNYSSFYNSGTVNATEANLTSYATYLNDPGAVTNVGTWYQSNNTILDNYGEIAATVQFGNSGGGTVNNFCRIAALHTSFQQMTLNQQAGSLLNTGTFYVNNSTINMFGTSMFLTGNITGIYGMTLTSSSSVFALFKCTGNIPDMRYAASTVSGKIEFVHSNLTTGTGTNGAGLYSASFVNGALLTKTQTVNIVGNTCNGSLGQIEAPDGGDTGETDLSSYFPSQSGWASYAFEDLWPYKGDYDLNDIVIAFNVKWVANSSNLITEIQFKYRIMAVGATKTISAAFQLDNVQSSNIQSVTGQITGTGSPFSIASNGSEQGVSIAVIPVFGNAKNVETFNGFLNTEKGSYIPTEVNTIVVKFVSPVAQSSLAMDSFNFFIVPDVREKEIHLPGYLATSKFNVALASNASLSSNDRFKYNDGMMWGLMFPELFSYPKEKSSIVIAYPHFAEWATSGGTSYSDWYQDLSGYRVTEYLY